MAETLTPRRPAEDPTRIACKQRYADKEKVRRKWLREYGDIDEDGDYRRNKECLSEMFNLLDFVADNTLDGYLRRSTYLGLTEDGQETWQHHAPTGDQTYTFRAPTSYSNRIYALNLFLGTEHRLPKGVNKETRFLRNDLTHINATTMADQLKLDMDSLWQPLQDIGTALFQLGMLDRRDIVPNFDSLRVHEGGRLRNGKYEVGKLIGEGGMSRVYRGRQHDGIFERDIAIKELKPDRYLKETIRNECAVMIRLKHTHIPAIFDAFSQNGTYYIIMELIDGEPLTSYLQTHSLTDAQRDRIADGLCDVLSYLHDDGCALVYADLKPDNILVGANGDPFLIDFGITRAQSNKDSQRYLSPMWTAPEVLAGRAADKSADIYALGKVLSEVYRSTSNPARSNVLEMCTASDPSFRFASVRAVSAALKHTCSQVSFRSPKQLQTERVNAPAPTGRAGQPAAAAPQRPTAEEKKQKRQQTAVIVLICAIILAAAALLALLLLSPKKDGSEALRSMPQESVCCEHICEQSAVEGNFPFGNL